MTTPRREFLRTAFMSAAAVALVSQSARFTFGQKNRLKDSQGYYQLPAQTYDDPLFHYTRASFEPYLQSEFRATVGPYRTVILTLIKLEDLRPRARKGAARTEGECFSLLFQASGELSDLQQTYVLQHGALGKLSLFLVDASEKGKGIFYHATINHMRPTDNPSMKNM